MIDKLDKIFSRQLANQKMFFPDWESLSEQDKQELTQKFLTHIMSEGADVLDNIGWKLSFIKRRSPQISNVQIEIIDVAKYVISLALLWEMTAEDFFEQFNDKSTVVEARYEREKAELEGIPIFATDIDGVLADWFGGLLSYSSSYFDKTFDPDLLDNHHISAVKEYCISKPEEEELKSHFIEQGGYRTLSVIDKSAPFALRKIKEFGYKILVLSCRPEKQHRRAFGDTLDWFLRNKLCYDHMFWGSNKAELIAGEIYPAKISYIVEDRLDNAIAIAKHYPETTVFLINRPYNKALIDNSIYPNITRVNCWKQILTIMKGNKK